MIAKLRIDDRLLHGQVAYSWKSALNYNAIVIASDAAANDDIRKAAMKLAKPDGVNLAIRTIEEAATLLKNPKLEDMKVFVVCGSPKDAARLLALIDEKPVVNLGGMQMAQNKVMFSNAVYVDESDVKMLDELQSKGYVVEVQEVPSTAVKDYNSLRSKVSF